MRHLAMSFLLCSLLITAACSADQIDPPKDVVEDTLTLPPPQAPPAPLVRNLTLSPAVPAPGLPVRCLYEFDDPQGGPDRSTVVWRVAGVVVEAQGGRLTGAEFTQGQAIECEITPSNGQTQGPIKRIKGRSVTVQLLQDTDPRGQSGGPAPMTMFKGRGYFFATDAAHGRELWVTDGTPEGTTLFKDLVPGAGSSTSAYPDRLLLPSGDKMFFVTNTRSNTSSLWVTDGTSEGTLVLKEIQTTLTKTCFSGSGLDLVAHKGGVVFADKVCSEDASIWFSDGTATGTQKLLEFDPNLGLLISEGVRPCAARACFSVRTSTGHQEWWSTDGTPQSTQMFKEVNPKKMFQFSEPQTYQFKGLNYAILQDDASITSLWATDGTAAGTWRLKDLDQHGGGGFLSLEGAVTLGDRFYFVGPRQGASTNLWTSDGTPQGTHAVEAAPPGSVNPRAMFAFKSSLYFRTASGAGAELWRTDGTPQGTTFVTNALPRGVAPFYLDIMEVFATTQDLFFFTGYDTQKEQRGLWVSDGTPQGTRDLGKIPFGERVHVYPLDVFEGVFYFYGDDGIHGQELWRSDGTPQGTWMLADIKPGAWGSGDDAFVGRFGATLLFSARTIELGAELWRTDGTREGTSLFKDVFPGNRGAVHVLGAHDGILYFNPFLHDLHIELWRTDGTREGTWMLKEIKPEPVTAEIEAFGSYGDAIYFGIPDHNSGYELWKSDGTKEGTRRVEAPGLFGRTTLLGFEHLVEFKGKLYFWARVQDLPSAFWSTDGTSQGTTVLRPLDPEGRGSRPLGVANGSLILSEGQPDGTTLLLRSDGTPQGTVPFKTIPAAEDSAPLFSSPLSHNGRLYFVLHDPKRGPQVWTSDGTEAGTKAILTLPLEDQIIPLAQRSQVEFRVIEGHLFMVVDDGIHGSEPWVIDGETPQMLADTLPGGEGGVKRWAGTATLDGKVYFSVKTPGFGDKLWVTDATPAGTGPLTLLGEKALTQTLSVRLSAAGLLYFAVGNDTQATRLWATDGTPQGTRQIAEFPVGFSPEWIGMQAYGGNVYFNRTTPEEGQELWVTDGTPQGTALVQDIFPGPGSGFLGWGPQPERSDRLHFLADTGLTGGEPWVLK